MTDDYSEILGVLKEYEDFTPKAKWDVKQYSIGYGTRTDNPDEISGKVQIDEEEASKRLSDWVGKDREYIRQAGEAKGVQWNKNELDALTSFTYNLGRGNLNTLIEDRDSSEISKVMLKYNMAGGEVLEGLTTRRARESEMFMRPPEPEAVADRSYLDYTETNIPMSILRETPSVGEEPSIGEIWNAATYRHWLGNSMSRTIEAESGEWDRNYSVGMDKLVKYNDQGYKQEELEFLAASTSEENFGHRVERIGADRKAKAITEQGGVTGTGIEMLAGIADPALLPTLFLGGTAAAGGKWSTAKAIGLSMLSGASQNVAVEYMLKMGDTQRTDDDLILAAAGGALFSGTITAGARGYRSARTRIAQANEIESAQIAGVKDAMNGTAHARADEVLANEIPEPAQRRVLMTEKDIVARLQEESGTRQDALSSKKIKAAKDEFRAYRKSRNEMLEAISRKKIRPTAKAAESKVIEDAIAVREEKLNQLIAENNQKLSTNSSLDALQQGKIPDSLKARYAELKKENGEFDIEVVGFKDTKIRSEQPTDAELKEAPKEEAVGGTEARESIGAMQTSRAFADIKTYDRLLPETEIDKVWEAVENAEVLGLNTPRVSRLASRAKGFRSTSTIVDSAPDAATRGMGIQLLKNGTRTIKGLQSAEEVAETLFFRNTPDYLVTESAFDAYAKANGIGLLGKGRQALKEEFDKQVVLAQAKGKLSTNKPQQGDEPIIQAAKARSRIYERSLKNNKDYEVVGFDKIEHKNEYHSVVYSAENILDAAGKAPNTDYIVDCIAKAYENGGIKLTRENAVRLAQTQLERTFAYRHGENGTFKKAMSEAEFKLLDKELKDKGVDATVREELKASIFNKEDLATMSPRAMFSLHPDLTASSGGVRMVDLIDTSMNRVMKYASDSSANAGLASHGYHSRNQFLRAMEEARSRSISELNLDVKSGNPKVAEAAKQQLALVNSGHYHGLMDDALKLMYREPLQGIGNDTIEDLSKILRKQTSITRLRATGLMSIPENAIAMARNGALNTIAQLPKSRYFDLRTRSIEQDKFMNDFARTFSATGHQEYLFGSKFYNNSDFDDATRSKIGNMVNKVQGKMMNVTMTVNAFRTFQHGGEEMVARSIVSNIKALAKNGEITDNVRRSLINVGGLSDEQVTSIISHFQKHPDTDVFDSVRMMEPKLYNSLSVAVRNTIGSSFMRMGIGESVPYANRELGKIMTTLLNFTIGSWEKMVVRGIKSDGLGLMASMFAGQAALAMLSQYAYVYSRAVAKDEGERQAYIEKNLNDEALFWGVFNRVGFLAAPALPLQMLSAARLLPDELAASPTKAGISQAAVPSISMGQDLLKAAGSSGELIANQFNDEYMTNEERERNWRNIRRVLPWIDSPVYNFTIGQLD